MLPVARLRQALARFPGRRVIVIGDLIADEYLYGKPARISREAPVLILRFTEREVRLGGGANAVHNVHALGATVTPVGVVGEDDSGRALLGLLESKGIATGGILTARDRPTPVKTRIMAGGYETTRQQVVRLDREPEGHLAPEVEKRMIEALRAVSRQAEAFLLSDYGYGVVSPRVFGEVLSLAREREAVVTVDSRYDLLRFKGVTAATPNEPEVEALVGEALDDDASLEHAGRLVLDRLAARLLLITRGSRGMALLERDGPAAFIPIHGTDQIADVTGAGDTVISAFTVALAGGAAPTEAAWLANVAGGVVVMKRGTATAGCAEIRRALAGDGGSAEP
jgi:rfaE bifunctional protein kinase chain/domain